MAGKVKMNWRGHRLVMQMTAGARVGAERAGRILIQEASSLILDTAKTGRIYKRNGVMHQASAPGEPPANLTGTLVGGFKMTINQTGNLITASVTNSVRYAKFLEFGTRKMAARPFMRPAYAAAKNRILSVIRTSIQEKVK